MARSLTFKAPALALALAPALALPLLFVVAACGGDPPPIAIAPPPVASAPAAPAPSTAAVASAAEANPSSSVAAPPPPAPAAAAVAKYTGFATPESVLWDEANDRYLVSNINGKPTDADDNGFISVLSPSGQVTTLKWIEGGKNKVKLDAPKGLALSKGVLYVADITSVKMFDAKSGAPKGEVKIPGTTFLNDLTASADGKIYVSDSGLKVGANGFEPTGTDAVYVIENGKSKVVAKSADLARPNGLLATDKGLLVVTFGSGELYRLDEKGAKQDAVKLPKGALDGIVALPDGTLVISSWEGSALYRGKLGGGFEPVITDLKSPADIGYDAKRGRVLVPHFLTDTVEAFDLK